ncbi:MAG: FliM/FliN family flagellar motor switch protein [Planctomycetota bacterium]|jgi:flagellar motor switch protein FliN/FliY
MPADIQSILTLEVPLIVELSKRTMPLEEIMHLAPGSIIEMPKRVGEDLEILVNNMVVGAGAAVKVGENFGIRVSTVGQLEDRISAIAGGGQAGGASGQGPGMGDANLSDAAAESLADDILANL